MTFFVRTQIRGIAKSKRLLGTLLFAPALLLFCSYYASTSWIPAELVLTMFASLVAMLSSEILHWLTIDEIKDGLFDILLVSPAPRFQILLSKIVVPVVGSIILTGTSLLVNNYMSIYDHFTLWDFSFASSSFLIFAAIFSVLLEFISLLLIRRNNTNIHFFLLAGSIFLMLWVYDLIAKNLLLFYFIIISLIAIASSVSLLLLKVRYLVSMKRNDYCLPCLFGNSKCSTFGAFFRKNLSMIRHGKFTLLQFVLAMVSPVLFGIVANSLESMPIVIIEVLLLSAIPSVTNIYFIFYSSLFENRNKVNEILQIRNFSFAKRVTEKAVSAGIVSSVLCTVSFFIITIFFTSNFVLLLLTIINCFISSILCSFYSCNIHSFKAENVHKSVISFISIALQSVLLVFV